MTRPPELIIVLVPVVVKLSQFRSELTMGQWVMGQWVEWVINLDGSDGSWVTVQ